MNQCTYPKAADLLENGLNRKFGFTTDKLNEEQIPGMYCFISIFYIELLRDEWTSYSKSSYQIYRYEISLDLVEIGVVKITVQLKNY